MFKASKESIDSIKALYESHSGQKPTDDEAAEAAKNLFDFYTLLEEWDQQEKSKAATCQEVTVQAMP